MTTFDQELETSVKIRETITPMLDPDGIWRVPGYFIR